MDDSTRSVAPVVDPEPPSPQIAAKVDTLAVMDTLGDLLEKSRLGPALLDEQVRLGVFRQLEEVVAEGPGLAVPQAVLGGHRTKGRQGADLTSGL